MQQEKIQRATDMDMQGASDMSKQTLFNDTLEELIDACADYRESEQPDSGQGSWGRAMLYNQVLVQVRRVSDLVAGGALETDGGVPTDDTGGCTCKVGAPVLCQHQIPWLRGQ
ncbi:hypothetical protein PP340_gp27 [Arthrobacter phage Adaia]|uniref:Uncharacterized protein n=1 Tax=Arthrobacter phage Adaia TaxID=2419945 RepID=A0A3G2KCS2_9CAUD|nr:hypothetical protein PP340_gp27 [Arthrobacter phage Adaia]AYN56814.1 hypothetical protein PBI_ADAIA_27 [Arthrobacter phage Adaia]